VLLFKVKTYSTYIFVSLEMQKLGPATRGVLYIQLSSFPSHYLVLVITDEEFRYALISVEVLTDTMYANMIMQDIGWLDVRRIHGEDIIISPRTDSSQGNAGVSQGRDHTGAEPRLELLDTMRLDSYNITPYRSNSSPIKIQY
jgi:mediator of RNA polymerase II transcription subunit 14